jgi:hypothetical protein
VTEAQLRAYIERITYKPGWRIRVDPWHMDGHQLLLTLEWDAPCAVTGRPKLQVSARHILDPLLCDSERSVLTQVLWAIKRAEEHETLEFLKVDGVAPFDPHRNDAIERQHT